MMMDTEGNRVELMVEIYSFCTLIDIRTSCDSEKDREKRKFILNSSER